MRVNDLMHTPAVVCRPTATLREVAALMGERDVGSVLVVDNIGYVAGIVTDRDITLRGTALGHSPDAAVETVMTRDVACVAPGSDIAEAAAVMRGRGVRRVPVIDDLGKPHGMVAFDDLFRHLSLEADTLMDAVSRQAVGAR